MSAHQRNNVLRSLPQGFFIKSISKSARIHFPDIFNWTVGKASVTPIYDLNWKPRDLPSQKNGLKKNANTQTNSQAE